ncbi:MAG: NTP transferase domain-containing protein [Nanoarchaeota archaeon]|nr:NTP transferase domain-containing protein [Nanoarchaeota archaeon]MBU1269974.1 NTP transferase domain-containing protein [Nanoarchaeota archaeon]MBU1604097.1 NTP transferase domain-containing protein [Nanoarchaeota archaeon]MBU2443102.1 NTP transferase domain-containing protein [Nanoarchaeota archaeon]
MKERITLTLERNIIEKVDKSVDGMRIKNRSHAIELLLRQAIGIDKPTKVLILAGGKTRKFRLLGKDHPKSLMEIKGKPIIQYNIELFKKHGIKEILISAGHNTNAIKQRLGDGKKLGVNIIYLEEKNPLGTAGPLRLAKQHLKETFLMCNADELKDIDIDDMFTFHMTNKPLGTVALTTVRDPSSYGVALLNGNKILTFIEKPSKDNSPSNLINAGLYILEPEVINYVPEGYARMETDIFPKLASEEKLCGYPFSGQWFDTATPEKIKIAENSWRGFLQ